MKRQQTRTWVTTANSIMRRILNSRREHHQPVKTICAICHSEMSPNEQKMTIATFVRWHKNPILLQVKSEHSCVKPGLICSNCRNGYRKAVKAYDDYNRLVHGKSDAEIKKHKAIELRTLVREFFC